MKSITFLLAMLMLGNSTDAQPVKIKGTIRCHHRGANVTQGAERIIIKPMFDPSKSVMTSSNPSGYFEINTGLNYQKVKDSIYTLILISNCAQCARYSFKNLLISRPVVTVDRWRLEDACATAELPLSAIDTFFTRLKNDKAEKEKTVNTTAASTVAVPSFFNLLTKVVVEVKLLFPPDGGGTFYGNKFGPGRMHYGDFLSSSAFYNSSNMGFNFAPDRDVSEAVFWNPAVMSSTFKVSNLSAFSNFRNTAKAQLFNKITPRLSSGLGFIYLNQEEFRTVEFLRPTRVPNPPQHTAVADSIPMKLKEYAIYTSLSYAINSKLSAGLSFKFINQTFSLPLKINRALTAPFPFEKTIEYFDSSITKKVPELDLALSYYISHSFQIGVNFMNLLGTTLNSDAYLPTSDTAAFKFPKLSQFRRVGLGANYKLNRLNLGTDIILEPGGLYDISLGANFIPFNKALIYGGYSFKQSSFSLGLRLSYFKIAYINDNGYMVNDRKQPKNDFFDGRIYAGLVIDGWDKN